MSLNRVVDRHHRNVFRIPDRCESCSIHTIPDSWNCNDSIGLHEYTENKVDSKSAFRWRFLYILYVPYCIENKKGDHSTTTLHRAEHYQEQAWTILCDLWDIISPVLFHLNERISAKTRWLCEWWMIWPINGSITTGTIISIFNIVKGSTPSIFLPLLSGRLVHLIKYKSNHKCPLIYFKLLGSC